MSQSHVDRSVDAPFASRSRLLIGMTLVVIVLGGLVYTKVLHGSQAVDVSTKNEPLLAFVPSQVRQLEIHRGRKNFRLIRGSDDTWLIEDQTGRAPVPDDRVDEFLTTLAGLDRLVSIGPAAEVNLDEFGLAQPKGEIALDRAGEPAARILLGDRNPPLTGIYVEVMPGGDVALVGAVLLLEVEKLAALASAGAPEEGASADREDD